MPRAKRTRSFANCLSPICYLRTSFYWDNLIHFGLGPKRAADGTLNFLLPMGDRRLPGIAAEDIGACALGVFRRRAELIGGTVGIAGGRLSGGEMAQVLASVSRFTSTWTKRLGWERRLPLLRPPG